MKLSENQIMIARACGFGVGDVQIASDLVDQAIEKGVEAIAAVAELHHDPEFHEAVLLVAGQAIAAGAARPDTDPGNHARPGAALRIAMIVNILGGNPAAVLISQPRESKEDRN